MSTKLILPTARNIINFVQETLQTNALRNKESILRLPTSRELAKLVVNEKGLLVVEIVRENRETVIDG